MHGSPLAYEYSQSSAQRTELVPAGLERTRRRPGAGGDAGRLAYQPADCFRVHRSVVVPARTFPEPTALGMQAAATRTEKRHRLMAYGDRCRPPGRTTCLRPRISLALLF